jgi:hypothetical protein
MISCIFANIVYTFWPGQAHAKAPGSAKRQAFSSKPNFIFASIFSTSHFSRQGFQQPPRISTAANFNSSKCQQQPMSKPHWPSVMPPSACWPAP